MYPWKHHRRFNSYTEYIRNAFGGRIQKVVVDAGFTCPNRDGTKGTGGCTYCDNNAFNPSYCNPAEPLHEQISKGIEFHRIRYRRAQQFLIYFQPYSNTHAPLDTLTRLYEEALSYPGVKGIVLGTRPDCMDQDKLDYLEDLSKHYYLQVEYGVESIYNKTLERINRCHDFEISMEMIRMTHERGIRTGAHFIFGLPGETTDMMLAEAGIINTLGIHSIKFHQLQIVKGTIMEKEYIRNPDEFVQFTLDEYIRFIILFLERLDPSIVIERFSGEVPPPLLHHISWNLIRYDEVLRRIEKELELQGTFQGKRWKDLNN
jgi:radical SAM protein (TIGR01212 family)